MKSWNLIVISAISIEVVATDYKGIIGEAKVLATLHQDTLVKVPLIKIGIITVQCFSDNVVKTNCMLVFS